MNTLIAMALAQAIAGAQTSRELEQQIQRHDAEVKKEFGELDDMRSKAVQEVKDELNDMREDLKPPIEAVAAELRRLNNNLESQGQDIGKILEMVSDSLLPLMVAIYLGSKTPIGKRLLNGNKEKE